MSETFKYVRLEISSVLLRSWSDLLTLLRRKHSTLEKDYVAFLYCGKNKFKKGKIKNPTCIHNFKCSYFIYTPNNMSIFFNRYNKNHDKYKIAMDYKLKFLDKLEVIYKRFNEDFSNQQSFMFSLREIEPKTPFKRHSILQLSVPMITLNAAIVEGALREILARYIQNEINKHIDDGNRSGRFKHNNYQKILVSKQIKIESNSSYSSILDEYSIIFDLKISEVIRKEIIVIIESLFTLRNIFAHGTSIVTTDVPVEEDLYFKNWNTKVMKMQEVLKKYFGSTSIHENISDYRFAEFYMSYSKIYLKKIAEFVRSYDESGCQAVESVNFIKMLDNDMNISNQYNDNYLDLYNYPKS